MITVFTVDNKTPTDATKDPLLEPLQLGHLRLKNRIMSTSHAAGLGDAGMPAERYQRYHEEKAKGGLALTMFGGSSNIAADSPSVFDQLRVEHDAVIPYFQQFSNRIHQHGAALMCQITHLGRRGDGTAENWLPTIAPSAVRETLHRSIPRSMDEYDIKRVIKDFGQAARRCYEGGLDGLETMASGHLIGQFFSPDTNQRTDKFGGSLENRLRFALLVHQEIRKQTGDKFLVGIRMSMEEDRGGLTHDDALRIAEILQREGAIDFLNCNFGRIDTELNLAEKNMPGMTQPLSPFLNRMSRIKQAVSIPVFHAARIVDIASARHAIAEGLLDMVAMTRAHIADPQIVNKIQQGQEHRIRPCFGASHCMHKKPSCIHNVAAGRETELPQIIPRSASPGKAVLVIGGGPAGLEAARVAAERGHQVTLFEAASKLGGQVLLAARAGWRRDLMTVIDWRAAELEQLGVQIHYNRYVNADDVLALHADVVIVATGGIPDFGNMTGKEHCTSSWDILAGDIQPAEHVLVYDGTGRHEALSCAQYMAGKRAAVTLASIDDRIGAELGYAERAAHRKELYKLGISLLPELVLEAVAPAGNRLRARLRNDLTDQYTNIETDQVIVERGTAPVDELYQELRSNSANQGVTDINALLALSEQPGANGADNSHFRLYRVGDAVSSRSLHASLLDSFRLAVAL